MAVRRYHKRTLVASASAYIDPLHANSTISYKVISSKSVWGSVQLSDCNERIEWYFGTGDQVDKIDKAVALLLEFKAAFVEANKARRRKPARKK